MRYLGTVTSIKTAGEGDKKVVVAACVQAAGANFADVPNRTNVDLLVGDYVALEVQNAFAMWIIGRENTPYEIVEDRL